MNASAAFPNAIWDETTPNRSRVDDDINPNHSDWDKIAAEVLAIQTWIMQGQDKLVSHRNMIHGGDFSTNPAQRGTSQAADIANTVTYGPDRFFFKAAGAGGAINWAIAADTSVAGFSKSLKVQRKSTNADITVVNFGQVLESTNSIRCQGQKVTLSFYAKAGANFSAASSLITVKVLSGTGTDESSATLITGLTGAADVINTTQALTTTMTRYTFTGTVPATCTQLGLLIQFTPVGTASSDDSFTINGIQLESSPLATPFEHRNPGMELTICQRYYLRVNEPASGVVVGFGHNSNTNVQTLGIPCPTTMRIAPTVTLTVSTFKINSATGGVVAATTLAGATSTPSMLNLTAAGTGTTGQGCTLQGGGGTGFISATADL